MTWLALSKTPKHNDHFSVALSFSKLSSMAF